MTKACAACGAESLVGARYCMHCAAPLPLLCALCGADVPKDAKILQSRSALEGER